MLNFLTPQSREKIGGDGGSWTRVNKTFLKESTDLSDLLEAGIENRQNCQPSALFLSLFITRPH